MHDYAKLSDQARYEIEDLRAAGIEPTLDEIVELSALGWQVETPTTRLYLARGVPVTCGNLTLWPLTLRAQDWYRRVGCHIEGLAEEALAYSMAKVYSDPEAFYLTAEEAEPAVAEWIKTIDATEGMLVEAMAQVLDQDDDAEQPPDPPTMKSQNMTPGELSAFLAATCGGDPDFWEGRCSYGYAIDVLHAVVMQRAETDRPLSSDPRVKAERAFGWMVEKIKQRHAEETGDHDA